MRGRKEQATAFREEVDMRGRCDQNYETPQDMHDGIFFAKRGGKSANT